MLLSSCLNRNHMDNGSNHIASMTQQWVKYLHVSVIFFRAIYPFSQPKPLPILRRRLIEIIGRNKNHGADTIKIVQLGPI